MVSLTAVTVSVTVSADCAQQSTVRVDGTPCAGAAPVVAATAAGGVDAAQDSPSCLLRGARGHGRHSSAPAVVGHGRRTDEAAAKISLRHDARRPW